MLYIIYYILQIIYYTYIYYNTPKQSKTNQNCSHCYALSHILTGKMMIQQMAFWCNDHSWNEPEWGHDQMNQDELCNYISESIFRQRISGIGTSTAMGPPKSGGTVLEVSGFPACCRSSSFPLTHHLVTYIMLHHVTSIVII